MVKIIVKNISKVFKKGKVIALDNVNITIENGERFGILGPSGAGKTTFMRIIAGLDVPSTGELYFDDKLVASNGKLLVPPEDRKIGMVFQTWALYPNLTAFENIAFPLTNMKMSKEEIRKRVEEVAKILDIHHVLNHLPRELSGGQQQRVALARALVKDPSLLLLDEPFSNLDARMRDSARALVKEVQSRLGVTLLIVSHDPADIFAIADRVGVLVKGKLVQVGKPEEVYDNPVSIQVASLIGEINELEGKVTNEGVVIGSFRFPVSISNDKVLIGIRPEDVKLSKDVIRDDAWTLVGKGRVKVIGYQGGLFRITITPLNSDDEIFTYSDHPIHSGEEVLVYVKKDKIKVFEKN
ncbi:ABC transporter related [Sulfolobus islandicus Y.G.57.14]|uniref:ABC transporter ATP-binding protein n=6 Tax=Saccharolobus TaxID=2100760 RepID=A0A0E3K6V8_SACSO|nr:MULTISPECIES: glucose ABC transporter ATP-binding protein GlcV [Sulfolobaceae]ACP39177.1 ABC transporter related [Sulfolobus islandicus M.14.25]ACP46834.1 ABC transporter related [Sulfolobus islandicus Y.G.57.14]ADX83735.1 ABC transporter related protein [Sulfolobus islandicus HVE10/4]AGJ63739.1 ABC-type sugar transport systems, ATPase component [Sulfolobus islandicus LAL14/1]AKA73037.1 ABC transporter ATP-binding protein [Saccharolobus solfataricus]